MKPFLILCLTTLLTASLWAFPPPPSSDPAPPVELRPQALKRAEKKFSKAPPSFSEMADSKPTPNSL